MSPVYRYEIMSSKGALLDKIIFKLDMLDYRRGNEGYGSDLYATKNLTLYFATPDSEVHFNVSFDDDEVPDVFARTPSGSSREGYF